MGGCCFKGSGGFKHYSGFDVFVGGPMRQLCQVKSVKKPNWSLLCRASLLRVFALVGSVRRGDGCGADGRRTLPSAPKDGLC